jgi:hypothetical protein
MATTESRSGFRLPWAGEHRTDDQTEVGSSEAGTDESAGASEATMNTADVVEPAEAGHQMDATTVGDDTSDGPEAADSAPATNPVTTATESAPASTSAAAWAPAGVPTGRKPTKFLADLTKAMQAAAEAERQETLELFQLEAKSFVEGIHERSGVEAENLRKRADDDVAAIREWSKQEIARIREETDQKITARKAELGEEIDDHAARIEREIERVQRTVASYEQQMAEFFQSLLVETDPTRFAALAGSLPEPPSFDARTEVADTAIAHVASEPETPGAPETVDLDDAGAGSAAEAGTDDVASVGTAVDDPTAVPAEMTAADREAAFAAIEAAARAADQTDGSDAGDTVDERHDGLAGDASNGVGPMDTDPRLSALGLVGFDEAEAEALADLSASDEEIPEIADEALAARLAGLVPDSAAETAEPSAEPTAPAPQTAVVVVGLVSVASIASFKRHLSRVPGVRSVGVSSGPDGEFVFTVAHDEGVELREIVPTLQGFGARVTESGDGIVRATAHDVDAGS